MSRKKYIHTETGHNLTAPREIVPILVDLLKPRTVVDVGCGLGTFLHCFKEQGVTEIYGVDGAWVNKELLFRNIPAESFQTVDLEKPVRLPRKYDLAVCLEVVEHLRDAASDIIVESLVSLSDSIFFSAAIPGQGGQNHINEQWPQYWEEKFSRHGYRFHDVLRRIFWNNGKIDLCYKQNCFLVLKEGRAADAGILEKHTAGPVMNFVHPDLFEKMVRRTPGGFFRSLAGKKKSDNR